MKCTEFETVLNELLDLRLDLKSDVRISAHAASCQSCKEDLDVYASLSGLDLATPIDISSEQQVRLASSIRSRQVVHRKRLGYAVLTLAAALFLVLGPLSDYFFVPNTRTNNVAKAEPNERMGSSEPAGEASSRLPSSDNALDSEIQMSGNTEKSDETNLRQGALPTNGRPSDPSDKSNASDSSIENSNPLDLDPPQVKSQRANGSSKFWANNALNPVQDPFGKFHDAFQRVPETPGLDDLERVGESLETVWKTIQEDDYILPFVKQGALMLVRGS